MKNRTLGQTGLEVSEIGLGAFPISGMQERPDGEHFGWTGTEDAESIALIHRCEELGVNLIDTAEGYGNGHSELLTGNALEGRRDRWVVATKVQPNLGIGKDENDIVAVRDRLYQACEDSLERLKTDHIDLYQLHAIPYDWAMETVMQALEKLKQDGKIRWYGVSTNDRTAIDKLRALGPIHVLQVGYNLLERSADDLLHWAKSENIGTLIRVPLAKGMLTGKYAGKGAQEMPENDVRFERFSRPESLDAIQKLPGLSFLQTPDRSMVQAALRFVLDHPGVGCVISGAKNRSQVDENVLASGLSPLLDQEIKKALAITETIRTPGWI
jgi:myo-inositol catabolism protein IolS